METHSKPEKDNGGPNFKTYAKYSALIFNMIFMVGGGGYLGYWLDQKYAHKIPFLTIILLFLGIFVSLYQIIRQSKADE